METFFFSFPSLRVGSWSFSNKLFEDIQFLGSDSQMILLMLGIDFCLFLYPRTQDDHTNLETEFVSALYIHMPDSLLKIKYVCVCVYIYIYIYIYIYTLICLFM